MSLARLRQDRNLESVLMDCNKETGEPKCRIICLNQCDVTEEKRKDFAHEINKTLPGGRGKSGRNYSSRQVSCPFLLSVRSLSLPSPKNILVFITLPIPSIIIYRRQQTVVHAGTQVEAQRHGQTKSNEAGETETEGIHSLLAIFHLSHHLGTRYASYQATAS